MERNMLACSGGKNSPGECSLRELYSHESLESFDIFSFQGGGGYCIYCRVPAGRDLRKAAMAGQC